MVLWSAVSFIFHSRNIIERVDENQTQGDEKGDSGGDYIHRDDKGHPGMYKSNTILNSCHRMFSVEFNIVVKRGSLHFLGRASNKLRIE